MTKIMTTSQLQKQLSKMHEEVHRSPIIVTNNGTGSFVLLPYFDDNDSSVDRYLEDYEMYANKDSLQKYYRESKESGLSDYTLAA